MLLGCRGTVLRGTPQRWRCAEQDNEGPEQRPVGAFGDAWCLKPGGNLGGAGVRGLRALLCGSQRSRN